MITLLCVNIMHKHLHNSWYSHNHNHDRLSNSQMPTIIYTYNRYFRHRRSGSDTELLGFWSGFKLFWHFPHNS